MSRKTKRSTSDLSTSEATRPIPAKGRSQARLAKGFSTLQTIERRRASGQHSLIDRLVEQRIIWRELLELEVQSVLGLDGAPLD